ncbi:MAG: SDR family NAD(P)-dependent oxidoreductase [Eubacterium sp.]
MRYALVTGATGGLGGEVATALANEGWYVFAAGRNEKALATIEETTKAHPLKMDIIDQESIDAALEEVKKVTDHLDALINFSGVQRMASLIEGDIETVEKVLDVNLIGMMRVNKTFFPLVDAVKGRIINCSSECGWMTPQPFNGPYTLSKYAVEAYNDSLRRELMFLDIPVIKIQPGSFKTAMHGSTLKSFDDLINSTKNYHDVLQTMKVMMQLELKMANDPKYLVNAVLDAVNSRHPRTRYRVKNSKILGVVEILIPPVLDGVYKSVLKSKKVSSLMTKLSEKIS